MSETALLPTTNPFSTLDQVFYRASLSGLCSANGNPDEPCHTIAIAIDRLSVKCAANVRLGDKIIFSFSEFGLVEAAVAETFLDGFEASFEPATNSKLALYVAWLQDTPRSERDDERIVPVKRVISLGLAGEAQSMARIIDLSRSGVSVTTSRDLAPEQPVIIGPRTGHVAELFDGGATVKFDELIPEQDFNPLIDLRSPTGC